MSPSITKKGENIVDSNYQIMYEQYIKEVSTVKSKIEALESEIKQRAGIGMSDKLHYLSLYRGIYADLMEAIGMLKARYGVKC